MMSKAISSKMSEFITARVEYVKQLKNQSETQSLFVQLAEKYLSGAEMSAGDLSGLKTLAQAEQLEEKLQNAKAAARKVATTENEKIRKARTHELIKSAGLLVKAGLVDGKTGKPRTSSPEILLGALIELEKRHPSEEEKKHWAEIGRAAMTTDTPKEPRKPKTEPKNPRETDISDLI